MVVVVSTSRASCFQHLGYIFLMLYEYKVCQGIFYFAYVATVLWLDQLVDVGVLASYHLSENCFKLCKMLV